MVQIEPYSWQARFLSYVARPKDGDGCWLWFGATQQQGYGLWTFYPPAHPKKKLQVAHRVMWELVRGPIPAGLELDHLCRQKSCVNPDHLEPVTHAVNLQRCKTHCKNGHDLNVTGKKTSEGKRYCVPCRRVRWRDRQRERRAKA
jgi:hypothetical protein